MTRAPASTQILVTRPDTWAEIWARLGDMTSPRTSSSRGHLGLVVTVRTRPAGAAALSGDQPRGDLAEVQQPRQPGQEEEGHNYQGAKSEDLPAHA